jgi:hypothetical protein
MRRSCGKSAIQTSATATVPMPPISTAGTTPNHAAVRPDSKSPSWFEVPVNSELTVPTVPFPRRQEWGVKSANGDP